MTQYVFAPAGAKACRNNWFRIGIEYIGSKQGGVGSAYSKGKRYIRAKLNCSGRAISRSCSVCDKYFNHLYQQYGPDVYFFHKEWCSQIVDLVISYLSDHQNDPSLPQIFVQKNYRDIFNDTYLSRYNQLHWVENTNYRDQGEDAEKIYKALTQLL